MTLEGWWCDVIWDLVDQTCSPKTEELNRDGYGFFDIISADLEFWFFSLQWKYEKFPSPYAITPDNIDINSTF